MHVDWTLEVEMLYITGVPMDAMMQYMPAGMPPQMGMPPQGPMGMRPPLLGNAPPGFMNQRQMGPGPPNRYGPPGNQCFHNFISS